MESVAAGLAMIGVPRRSTRSKETEEEAAHRLRLGGGYGHVRMLTENLN